MEEFTQLFERFKKLGLQEKRNQYSEEVIKLSFILQKYLKEKNMDIWQLPHNYQEKEKNLTESQMLDQYFKDIYILKCELMILLSSMSEGEK